MRLAVRIQQLLSDANHVGPCCMWGRSLVLSFLTRLLHW
jgi:hypothetical protein